MVFHYPIDPWRLIDAVKSGDKENSKEAKKPVLYSEAHAEHEFSVTQEACWHPDSDKGADKPRLCLPKDPTSVTSQPDCNGSSQPIGVLIEYCCSKDGVLCDDRFAEVEGGHIMLIRLAEEQDTTSKDGLEYATSLIRRYAHLPISFWSSFPSLHCAGVSTVQRRNKFHP